MQLIGAPTGEARRFVGASIRLPWVARVGGDAFEAVAGELAAFAGRQ